MPSPHDLFLTHLTVDLYVTANRSFLFHVSDILNGLSSCLHSEDEYAYRDDHSYDGDQDEHSAASHGACNTCYKEREEDIADTAHCITESGAGELR